MGVRTNLLSPYAVSVAARVAAQINSFVLIMVASRALSLSDFGSYAIGWAFSVVFTTLVYTGVYHVFLRAKDRAQVADTIFWIQVVTGLIGGATMVSVGVIASGFESHLTSFCLFGLAPIPLIASYGAWNEAQLVRQRRIRTTSLTILTTEFIGLVAAVLMFQNGYGVEALIVARFATTLSMAALSTWFVRRRPHFHFDLSVAKTSLHDAWPLWGSSSLGMSSYYAADFILAAFLNPTAVGIYRAGARVANTAADVVLQPLGTISWARFARLEANKASNEIGQVWKQNMALGFTLIVPVMASISLLSKPLVDALFDPSWGEVAAIVSILALARLTNAFRFLLEPTMVCLGKPRVQFYVTALSVTLLISLLVSVGSSSLEAAVWSVFANGVIIATLSTFLMLRATKLHFTEFLDTLTPGLALTVLCVGAIVALDPTRATMAPLVGLALTVAVLSVVWFAFVALMLKRGILVLPTP